jgi:tRNA(fMet)-specific endonuclease VapC
MTTNPAFLVDTNICIYLLNGSGEKVRQRLEARRYGEVVTSAIVAAEVLLGAAVHHQRDRAAALFLQVPVLPFDAQAAEAYAALPFSRGSFDRLIAAHARSRGLTLVTNNEADFADVPGLRVENWAR